MRPARILSPFLAPCKRLEITADPNNYFPGMFRLMFRRNFRLPPTLPSTLITCPRFRPQTFVPRLNFSLVATNLNLFSAFYYTVLLFLFLFYSLPFRSSKKKNPLIDKRFSFFSFPFSASIDKHSTGSHFVSEKSELIGNFVARRRNGDGSKSVTRWHRFPGTMQSERRGNPWERRAHFPGTRYFVDKTGLGLIDILPTVPDCTIAPATSSRRGPVSAVALYRLN